MSPENDISLSDAIPSSSSSNIKDKTVQTELSMKDIAKLELKIESAQIENSHLREKTLFTRTFYNIVNI